MTGFVHLAIRRMESSSIAAVTAACEGLGLRIRPWLGEAGGGGAAAGPGMSSALVVAGLQAGERKIPGDVAEFVRAAAPDAPLLLLASEPLVEPVVTLEGGKVLLVGVPLTRDRIQDAVRLAMTRAGSGRAPASVVVRERLQPRWWMARVSSQAAATRTSPEDGLPAFHESRVDGMTALLSSARVSRSAVDEAVPIVTGAGGVEDKARDLAALLQQNTNLVHLTATADAWTFYWPSAVPLWLISPARLPARWNLGAALRQVPGVPCSTIAARPEDLIVATTAPLGEPATWSAIPTDGPSVLEWLEQLLSIQPAPASALVAMVRR